jgi:trans-2,3-dihydro-3-hydroxyanthranilate isomerase
MFAPLDGVPEDPATGSANLALAALLSHCDSSATREINWRIAQGVEMGRPSILDVRTRKKDGIVEAAWIAGDCVMVCEGMVSVE